MKRIRLWSFLSHATVVFSMMFVVFFFIDRVNPAMGFLESALSKWVLLLFCLIALSSSVFSIVAIRRALRKRSKRIPPAKMPPNAQK